MSEGGLHLPVQKPRPPRWMTGSEARTGRTGQDGCEGQEKQPQIADWDHRYGHPSMRFRGPVGPGCRHSLLSLERSRSCDPHGTLELWVFHVLFPVSSESELGQREGKQFLEAVLPSGGPGSLLRSSKSPPSPARPAGCLSQVGGWGGQTKSRVGSWAKVC